MVILLYRHTTVEVPFQSYAHAAFDIINFPNKFMLSEIFKNYQTKVYNTEAFCIIGTKGSWEKYLPCDIVERVAEK